MSSPTPATPFDLTGRTAVVTGANRGIGAAAARALDAAGARVVLCARDDVLSKAVAATLTNDPVVISADLATEDGVQALLDAIRVGVDRVDILINNAGVHIPTAALDMESEDWAHQLQVNLTSAFLLARGLAGPMCERGWGRIINVASIFGIVGDVSAAAYATSKSGIIGLTRGLSAEWAPKGVTVNAICPGWIATDMTMAFRSSESLDRRVRRRTSIGRWGEPEDLAGPFVYLASPGSGYMTGQTLVVDGGLTACW